MYILSIAGLIAIYVIIIFTLPKLKNVKLFNALFCLITFAFYAAGSIVTLTKVGFNDWNFQNTLPTANVSPFMFTFILLYFVLPDTLKKYLLTLISLLSVGMFFAACISGIYFQSIAYKFHPSFLLDYIAHFALSLWGVYAVVSGQVDLNKKNVLKSGSIIVIVAAIMTIINVIFDTAFFGLSLNGKHNIYNFVLVENSYLSALLYFIGLIAVLATGYAFQRTIKSVFLKKKI